MFAHDPIYAKENIDISGMERMSHRTGRRQSIVNSSIEFLSIEMLE